MEVVLGIVFFLFLVWLAINFWYISIPLIAVAAWFYFESERKKEESKREQAAAVLKAQRDAEALRRHNEQTGYRDEMRRLGATSLDTFEAAPKHLEAAERSLDQAELDFAEGVFAPFWDSVERATTSLGRFDEGVRSISQSSVRYLGLTKLYESPPPHFPLSPDGVSKLSAATGTSERMKAIVRNAQRNFQFATIYEQRKTNQILVAGFTSLGQALEQMTWRITTSIDELATSVDSMSSTLDASVRAVDARLGEMHAATARHHEAVLQHDKDRSAREISAVEMLDNIQRRRKPSSWS